VPERALRELANGAAREVLSAVGPHDHERVGWTLVSAGTLLVRNADKLVPQLRDNPDDAFETGLTWAGIVAAIAGDEILQQPEQASPAAADSSMPGAAGGKMGTLAHELVEQVLGVVASPDATRRFADDMIRELTANVPTLPGGTAGSALLTLGVWFGSEPEPVVAPLRRRRLIGHAGPDPGRAGLGCAYAGALLAAVGTRLVDDGC
jgi:hypothetical protein